MAGSAETTRGDESSTSSESASMDASASASQPTVTDATVSAGDSSSTSPDDGPVSTTESAVGCECILMEDEGAPSLPTCGEMLCPQVALDCPGKGAWDDCEEGPEPTEPNPGALQCALEALRDGEPGVLSFYWAENFTQAFYGYVLIQDDRTAVVRTWGSDDCVSGFAEDAVLGSLQESSFYEECLADPDPFARFACLRALATEEAVCDDGWEGGNDCGP